MNRESKYLEFRVLETKPKTIVCGVFSKTQGIKLGIIKWYGPWRQYAFFPEKDTLWNFQCLKDIVAFVGEMRMPR